VCTATGVHFRSNDLHRKICVLHYVTEYKTNRVTPQSKTRPASVRGLVRYTMAHFASVTKCSFAYVTVTTVLQKVNSVAFPLWYKWIWPFCCCLPKWSSERGHSIRPIPMGGIMGKLPST